MQKLLALKEKLCKQLEEYPEKDLNQTTLEIVDKLTHTIKNLDKIIEKKKEEEYSNAYGASYAMYDRMMPIAPGNAFAGGRGQRRDSMGRYSNGYQQNYGYSRNGNDMIMDLTNLMNDAPDDYTRMAIQNCINGIQNR